MSLPFEPHQLDFDWRFTKSSAAAISEQIPSASRLLLVGCPSLMEAASPKIDSGLLIERNPYHVPTDKFSLVRADLRFYAPRQKFAGAFDATIFDPPWYPDEFLTWARLALSYTRQGGSIFFLLWPEDTRPTAKAEHAKMFQALEAVGSLQFLGTINYELPPFEIASFNSNDKRPNFHREGLLYCLRKETEIGLSVIPAFRNTESVWNRYRIATHQFAIKLTPSLISAKKAYGFLTEPRTLKDTSRRNNETSGINTWTSSNVVAKLINPRLVDDELRRLMRGHKREIAMSFLRDLGITKNTNEFEWGKPWQHLA